jgi:hypothetical protein
MFIAAPKADGRERRHGLNLPTVEFLPELDSPGLEANHLWLECDGTLDFCSVRRAACRGSGGARATRSRGLVASHEKKGSHHARASATH